MGLKTTIKHLPENPGVYLFRNDANRVLYVGKAINLKNRVSSYFQKYDALAPKTKSLVSKVAKIEHIKVENEIEALLLEADLIKRYRPPFNISLKDDKFYVFIKISKDSTSTRKIGTSRRSSEEKSKYFGPYPEGSSVKILLQYLRKIFPYRDCSVQKFNTYKHRKRPCLYGYIGACTAPCQGNIRSNEKNISQIEKYLKGERKIVLNNLKKEMTIASKAQKYEEAAIIRDQIASFEYVQQTTINVKEYLSDPSLVDDKRLQALTELIKILESHNLPVNTNKILTKFRIETYDISNFQGKNPVGSMIVFTGGAPDKKEYRRFHINTKNTPDDFAMMQEMLSRRIKNKWPIPDLIVIDGGKGQLNAALAVIVNSKFKCPLIALAKKYEEIYYDDGKEIKKILLPSDSMALKLLQQTRDEAHRFAINFYRKKHSKNLLK